MTEEEYQYINKVYDFLLKMKPGQEVVIDNICKKDTKEQFIEAVKSFILATKRQRSYGIEFTEDYERIRKMDFS